MASAAVGPTLRAVCQRPALARSHALNKRVIVGSGCRSWHIPPPRCLLARLLPAVGGQFRAAAARGGSVAATAAATGDSSGSDMATGKFSGKVALVTGGAKGIGFACAESLGSRGAKVMVADIDSNSATEAVGRLKSMGITAAAVQADVSSKAEVDKMVEEVVAKFGSLDIVVANAGIVKVAPFLEMTEEDWDSVIDVNLKGVFLTCQAGAKQMVHQNVESPNRGGAIITMSSVNGVTAIPTIAGYNASKGGIENLTRCMSLALVEHNIRVNAVGPGSIMTEVLQAVADDKAKMANILSRTPMGRAGDPKEIGEVCQFLASDEASYITGQTIFADGGRMALNYTVPVPPEYQ